MIAITIIYWFIPSNDSHIFPTLACSSSSATSFILSVFLFLLFYFIFLLFYLVRKQAKEKLIFCVFFVSQESKRKHWKIKLEPKNRKEKQKKTNTLNYVAIFFFVSCYIFYACNAVIHNLQDQFLDKPHRCWSHFMDYIFMVFDLREKLPFSFLFRWVNWKKGFWTLKFTVFFILYF